MADDTHVATPGQSIEGASDRQIALHDYERLNLTEGSALCQSLLAGLDREQVDGGEVVLTDQIGPYPNGLTPEMSAWLHGEILPLRTAALHALKAGFQGAALSKTAVGRSTLVPAELAKNDHDRLLAYHRVHSDFRRNHHDKLAERDSRAVEYQQARAEQGDRDPVMTNPSLYWVGLFAVVGIEIAINYESLLKLPMIQSGMFAVGLALLIGLAVGFAAHVHGTVLKQWHYWFNSFDRTRIWKASRQVAIGGLLLSVSLGMIGWARAFYVEPLIQLAEMTGETPPNMLLSIVFMTLSNVIVYGVGVIWAYFNHDEDPDYPPKKAHLDVAEHAVALHSKEINHKLKEVDDKHAQRAKELDLLDKGTRNSPGWDANNKAYSSFLATDRKVQAALQRYKSALIARLNGSAKTTVFIQPTVTRDDASREERLTGAQFLGQPVTLKLL